ncbi:glycoside hydrolase family 3 protein [Sphingomonas sabuli]|uniref:Glycoside hydrolase family 3 protein n=1 Tax=Sphingomonas sabuli TaxID=2764186 RepID=A0A7G9KZR8_9SPHN|nr:exo 1,3/1,4-beta-D-glucan glucohydrolase [Sphingomonas sabuli]QNM81867.1 glycoside hydrolase family 3 protein [Sphingomonas sabuli]
MLAAGAASYNIPVWAGQAAATGGTMWQAPPSPVGLDAASEARIDAILAQMSVEEKVAQTIQPDISSITPADLAKYKFGSILAGGNSAPGKNEKAPAPEWLKLADAFWRAADTADWKGPKIPLMWGIDAVHGHANIVGATIFPQNIGLGATRNPDLIRRIGEVTAREMVITGLDWDFSPTLAVARDDRWGRSYESFSENPEIVKAYAGAIVEGLQGKAGTDAFLGDGKVIATAKHFVGDGGTAGGKDQGDTPGDAATLRDIHGAGYPVAIAAGVQSIMASFSSVGGKKVHGDRDLLTVALKDQMRFDGLVVGDWNAHGQVEGCTNVNCPASINAGLDMYMAPDSWKDLYDNTLKQARSGEIPATRLDDAVRRILRVKMRAGLFAKGAPSTRPLAGQFQLLGSPEHRAVARQAVRESLVLLKNNANVLPIKPGANLLVTGAGADNISMQSGGWTITWQGSDLKNADFKNAQSIFAGLKEAAAKAGGSAHLSADGRYAAKPDVAVVVFGEGPYAEMVGDRSTLEFSPRDKAALETLKRLRAAGIPTVSVFLSGRPMWVNPEINASDAFVAAFLPGSEGGGVADVLLAGADGKPQSDFRGKLSFSWPKRVDQTPLNVGDPGYDPLFAFGYGLTYAERGDLPQLSEQRPAASASGADGDYFARGTLPPGWTFAASDSVAISAIDRRAQEDSRRIDFAGGAAQSVRLQAAQPIDISREANAELSVQVEYRVDRAPDAPVTLGVDGVSVPVTDALRKAPPGEWQLLTVPLRCLKTAGANMGKVGAPFVLSTNGKLTVVVSDVRVASAAVPQDVCAF